MTKYAIRHPRFIQEIGHLPPLLQAQVANAGCEGAIGFELLKRFPIVIADGGVWV